MSEERLKHEMPSYTVVSKRREGSDVITTVIMKPKIMEFVASDEMLGYSSEADE